ncbi:alpha/beta fold hydrolase [Lacisediminihabitans profunda]|uniref:Alpha/beta fold hydrolase n=1 Tax=Lacisediminihabitans profunda TaxID=2594790 RepID=A0A5C8ULG8_9MICO|nr:alpha/beta hydrolase [Lacisediminihabitans profunda]TXN28993.1 alpha/beta fold hydrolase [Lacisediminihabitans profunda]
MRIATDLGWLDARVVPGPSRVAVLWHSMFTDSRSWDRVVDDLRKQRTLVLVDGWSFGASDDLDELVDDFIERCAQGAIAVVSQIQQELTPGPVDWVGSAWGGHVGLQLAAVRPDLVRSLITVSTPVQAASAAMRRQVGMLLPVFRAIGMRGPVRHGLLDGMFTDLTRRTDPEAVDALVAPMSRSNRAAISRTVHSGVLNRTDLAWAAARVTCPTLMIATDDRGEWSPAECAKTTAAMKDSRTAVLTGTRALPSLECPTELAALVTDFWAGQVADETATLNPA